MTIAAARPGATGALRTRNKGNTVVRWITSTDHKVIGQLYLITSFIFFLVGGLMAMLMRAELARPGNQFFTGEQYNQLFTMHGTIMLLLFATPLFVGLRQRHHAAADRLAGRGVPAAEHAELLVLPVRRPDRDGRLPDAGRRGRLRLVRLRPAEQRRSSRRASAATCGSWAWRWPASAPSSARVNFITTIFCMRAPGMTMFRMPIFTWNILLTSVLVLMAFPVLAAALLALEADRKFGAHVFDPGNDGAILWQHLFWFFGHPEVYIIALPFFGIVSEVLPVFSRKPIFGYKGLVFATIAIAGLSVTVWAHHMFPTGAVLLPFFSFMTFLIAVPTGVKFFNWIGTMWRGVTDLRDADAVGDRLPRDVPVRRPDRHDPGLAAAGLAGVRLLLRGGALPLRRVRHRRVRHERRLLLLVAEDDRPDARRAARQDPLLDAVHRLPHDVPHPALAGRDRHAAPVRRLPGRATDSRPTTRSPPSGRSCSAPRRCRSSTTSSRACAGRRSPPTTRGATAARWSGRRPARRRGTTSSSCRGSGPSRRPSTCTTRTSPRWTRRPRTRTCSTRSTASPTSRAAPGVSAMKVEGWLFAAGFFFFALAAVVYWLLPSEPVGTVALAFTAGLAFLIGYYLLFTAPADRPPARGRPSTPRSPTAPASWASTARTAGGRWPVALFAAIAFLGHRHRLVAVHHRRRSAARSP